LQRPHPADLEHVRVKSIAPGIDSGKIYRHFLVFGRRNVRKWRTAAGRRTVGMGRARRLAACGCRRVGTTHDWQNTAHESLE